MTAAHLHRFVRISDYNSGSSFRVYQVHSAFMLGIMFELYFRSWYNEFEFNKNLN
jgi:hypothetical protein